MSTLKQLTKEDVLFIAGETNTVYQHTAGLAILNTSAAPDFNFETFRDRVIERIKPIPNFRWKLQEVPMRLDLPYWVEDENFDYKRHFKRIAVPAPGDKKALAEVVAHLYSKHLDRSKPLWEVWLIEGLADGKFAMLQKSHHCMMDGEGSSQLSEILGDLSPDAEAKPVDKNITSAKAGDKPSQWQMSINTSRHLARLPRNISKGIYDFLRPKLWQQLSWNKSTRPEKAIVPATSFNAKIGSERGFVFGSLPLADIKAVKAAFEVSLNDVILGLVGSCIRKYLLDHSELPDTSVRTSIIVSLRTEEDDKFSNKVSSASLTLATDIEDPVKRLHAINRESVQVKQQVRAGGMGIVEIIQLMPPLMVNALASAAPPEMSPQMMGANLIVSNVRGSEAPLYIAGARLETAHPMSIITQGIGINITCVSYAGKVGYGVTIDPELVPHPWDIADNLSSALQDYLALAKKVPVKKKMPAKRKVSTRRKVSSKNKTTQ